MMLPDFLFYFVSSQLICIYIYTDNMCDQVCSYEIPVWCDETSVMMVGVNKSWLWGWKKKKYFHQLTAAETKQKTVSNISSTHDGKNAEYRIPKHFPDR